MTMILLNKNQRFTSPGLYVLKIKGSNVNPSAALITTATIDKKDGDVDIFLNKPTLIFSNPEIKINPSIQ
jgi:hypothetical protein